MTVLPDGFEWAAPGALPRQWCVLRSGTGRMLCGVALDSGKHRGFIPVQQPDSPPSGFHERCLELAASRRGDCPVCGADVALDGGRIVAHGRWLVTRDGVERTGRPCAGAGQSPEVDE